MSTLRLLARVAPLLVAGCNFFDPSLYMNGDLPPFELADTCGPTTTVPTLSDTFEGIVDLGANTNTFDDLGACVDGTRTPGPDGFFSIHMAAGEKWHFHAKVLDEQGDPALYLLDTCDDRSCQMGAGIDICGSGEDEHFSFVSPREATYFVTIDDKGTGGGRYDLLAIRPTCGNGEAEHSEGCDDGNTTDGDGCDATCHVEIPSGGVEDEPNDDFTGSNRVMAAASGVGTVSGLLEGRCDPDFYVLDVPEGGTVRARMTTDAGAACAVDAPTSVLELVGADGVRALGAGSVPSGEGCPSIDGDAFATGLSAGTYYVRLTSPDADTRLPYRLELSVL